MARNIAFDSMPRASADSMRKRNNEISENQTLNFKTLAQAPNADVTLAHDTRRIWTGQNKRDKHSANVSWNLAQCGANGTVLPPLHGY